MRIIKIWSDSPSATQLDDIIDELRQGNVIIYPTDTVYALACDALNVAAVDTICHLKGINPAKSNLSVVCADISQAAEYARIDNAGFKLMRDFTPGPVTFLFRALGTLPRAFKSRKTVGIRIPASNTAREIVRRLGQPLLTSSIPIEDEDVARNPELIAEEWEGRVSLVVDGGEGDTTLSSIVDCTDTPPTLIRPGKSEIDEVL